MKYFNKAMILEEVKAAYRAAAIKLHPDRSGSNEAMQQLNQQPRRSRRGCCSHKVVAVGFNTLCYDASVGVLNPPHE